VEVIALSKESRISGEGAMGNLSESAERYPCRERSYPWMLQKTGRSVSSKDLFQK
jgi:hypothetical protein